tara:strand:- start:541 stop:816 length:276 start_codon:yes stop_codon:yes gene_type:complete
MENQKEVSQNQKPVSTSKASKPKKKQPRKNFVAVDVYQARFGIVSERAVYDVYADRFKVQKHNMKKYSFQHCVKALRNLNDPKLGAALIVE